ncbi:unnamed protein product [Dimorphilus gyrociliatus]|uniref:Uncharacterized protein n=1 Tax=Dimorphilus gyrociliatus TaxID=2664684 RepID=A0A7I8VC95_9ANNE|nr:unnamed protein product [Dimorphilus gyrociliatus]
MDGFQAESLFYESEAMEAARCRNTNIQRLLYARLENLDREEKLRKENFFTDWKRIDRELKVLNQEKRGLFAADTLPRLTKEPDMFMFMPANRARSLTMLEFDQRMKEIRQLRTTERLKHVRLATPKWKKSDTTKNMSLSVEEAIEKANGADIKISPPPEEPNQWDNQFTFRYLSDSKVRRKLLDDCTASPRRMDYKKMKIQQDYEMDRRVRLVKRSLDASTLRINRASSSVSLRSSQSDYY